MLLLEQDTTKKEQFNKVTEFLKPKQNLDIEDNKKYKVEVICDSKVYAKEIKKQLPKIYYLIS